MLDGKNLNDGKTYKLTDQIMNLEQYYSIEDYGNILTVQTCLQTMKGIGFMFQSKINLNKNNEVTNTTIRVSIQLDNKVKEIFLERAMLNRVYAICKIYSENNDYFKIIINRSDNYNTTEILNKINKNRIFRGAFKTIFKIDEFPLKNYYLEEKEIKNNGNNDDTEKEFLLKKIISNPNNINQNNMSNNGIKILNPHTNQVISNNINSNLLNNYNKNFDLQESKTNTSVQSNQNLNKNILNNIAMNNNNIQANNYNMNQNNNLNLNNINQNNNNMNQNNNNMNQNNNNMYQNNCNMNQNNNNLNQNNNNNNINQNNYNINQNNNNINLNNNNMNQNNNNMNQNNNNMNQNNNNINQNNFNVIQNNFNLIQNNNMNQIICNQNFQNNINDNLNQNNNIYLMNYFNHITQLINNNKFLLEQIKYYIQSENIDKNLFQMIVKLIQINDNILNNSNNINEMEKIINSFLYNLKLLNNNKNQANQINNNNQMNFYLKQIITNINQIHNYFKIIMNLYCNFCNINSFNSNNFLDNNGNNDKIIKMSNEGKANEIIEKQKDNDDDRFLFKNFENYFPQIGLRNVGLTCYMNSILQCLLHIHELNGFFINKYPEQKNKLKKINKDVETRGELCEEYYKIVNEIYKVQNKSYVIPKDFNSFLSNANGQFAQYEANDAKDLLLYLLQAMHSELNYNGDEKLKNVPKCNQTIEKESFNFFMTVNSNLNLSIISYLFYGINKSITVCLTCKKTLYNFQYFQFLSFPTFNFKNKKFNIYQGFKEFGKPELMTGDNKCYCQNCKGLRDAKVTTRIYSAPPYLIINFDYGKNKKYMPKEVAFGGIIDLTDFVDIYDEKYKSSVQYKLIAVSTHIGRSGSSGHYITYCQNNENKWFEFNDSNVSPAKLEEINSYSPYVLVYKKI